MMLEIVLLCYDLTLTISDWTEREHDHPDGFVLWRILGDNRCNQRWQLNLIHPLCRLRWNRFQWRLDVLCRAH